MPGLNVNAHWHLILMPGLNINAHWHWSLALIFKLISPKGLNIDAKLNLCTIRWRVCCLVAWQWAKHSFLLRYLTILLLLLKTWMDVTHWVTHQSTEMCLSWRLWSMASRPCWKFCNIFHNIFGSFPSMSPHGFVIFCS